MSTEKAVVLHSGGQDSTTCLAWAIDEWGPENVLPLIIDYGQRHRIEIEQARKIVDLLIPGRKARELRLDVLRDLGGAALTDSTVQVNTDATYTGNRFAREHGLPSTFVPGRNLIFLSLAAAYGAQHGAWNIVTGVCEADEAGYPDCRREFIRSAELTLRHALDDAFIVIHAPLLRLNKAATFAMAEQLNVLELVLGESHTCYHGDRSVQNPWGFGCGECGACKERAKGWHEYRHPETIDVV